MKAFIVVGIVSLIVGWFVVWPIYKKLIWDRTPRWESGFVGRFGYAQHEKALWLFNVGNEDKVRQLKCQVNGLGCFDIPRGKGVYIGEDLKPRVITKGYIGSLNHSLSRGDYGEQALKDFFGFMTLVHNDGKAWGWGLTRREG